MRTAKRSKAAPPPSREDISRLAYQIWVEQGRPGGREIEHWLEAEARLMHGVRGHPAPGAGCGEARELQERVDSLLDRSEPAPDRSPTSL